MVLKIIFSLSLMMTSLYADDLADYVDNCNANSSTLMKTSHLSCVVCGLKRAGMPAPDENYLALMGLIARESTVLFDDEKIVAGQKNPPLRRGLGTDQGMEFGENKPVWLSAKMQYQKEVLKMVLAGGYCKKGTIENKNTNFAKYSSVLNSVDHTYKAEQLNDRQAAYGELGHPTALVSYQNIVEKYFPITNNQLITSKNNSYDEQVRLFTENRKHQRDSRNNIAAGEKSHVTRTTPKGDFDACLDDIDNNYAKDNLNVEKARKACEIVYDSCGIAVVPDNDDLAGATHRKDSNGNMVRVGGNWCAQYYPVTKKTKPPPAAVTPAPAIVTANGLKVNQQGQLIPIPTTGAGASSTSTVTTDSGFCVDLSKGYYDGNNYVIPGGAVYRTPAAGKSTNQASDETTKVQGTERTK